MPQTILLSGHPYIAETKLAGEANIMPGMLLTFGSSGTANKLLKHATANGNAAPMFALENVTPDRTVTTVPIDTVYASGESIKWVYARPGDVIYALLPASASAVIVGDLLSSNGDGTLRKYVPQASNEAGSATYTVQVSGPVAMAAEAVDNSAVGTTARIRVHVI